MRGKRHKKKPVFLILLSIVFLIGICKIAGKTIKAYSNGYDQVAINKNMEEISKKVKQSNDHVLKLILKNNKNNPNTYKILGNVDLYPRELLELASKKEEALNFVADYTDYKGYSEMKASVRKDYKKGKIPLFIQWDKRWGYEKYGSDFIAINGCGPTSLAMVAVGLTGNTKINPKVVADYSNDKGYLVKGVGTNWDLMTYGARNFKIAGREISLSKESILQTLRKGQPIIVSMGPGEFTTAGHYIVLTGVDSNNKIIVNDPDSKLRSKKTWDINIFLKEAKDLWAFKALQ
ncbi:C39 family peptidase [Terrisporobacter petrolearius]|uniref:C39 family peptidase n=1 Tax=Terrisporobacter petrolearius TaxID=1460447 RepID=UPI003B0072F4